MNMDVTIQLISEMKYWLMFVMEETGDAGLYNAGNLEEISRMLE